MGKTTFYNSIIPDVFYVPEDANNKVWYKVFGMDLSSISASAFFTQKKFEELKRKWVDETKFLSNPQLIYGNANYRGIIELGLAVVPYLLDDLSKNDNDWLFALREITNENPVKQNHYGFFDLMKKDWIDWEKKYNYEHEYYELQYAC